MTEMTEMTAFSEIALAYARACIYIPILPVISVIFVIFKNLKVQKR
jgi:hypothetical protein